MSCTGASSRPGRYSCCRGTALHSSCSRAVWLNEGRVATARLESRWDDPATAPGDDRARLHLVRVNVKGADTDRITVSTPLEIEFQYWNFVPGAVLNIAILLYMLEEVCIFNIIAVQISGLTAGRSGERRPVRG